MAAVTVIIPAFNAQATLAQTLESLRAQTVRDWDAVIVDDCSTDETPAIAAHYAQRDARLRYHRMEKNQGHAVARNLGARMSDSTWIAQLDADDSWFPTKLQRQLKAAQRPGSMPIQWSYHGMQMVRGKTVVKEQIGNDPQAGRLANMVVHDHVIHSSVIFRRSAFEAVGGYRPELGPAIDWDLWTRFAKRYGDEAYIGLSEVLGQYRVHDHNMSAQAKTMTRADMIYLRRTWLEKGWAWRHPLLVMKMLDGQMDRLWDRNHKNRRRWRCVGWALLSALTRPQRAWRWNRLVNSWRFHAP